MNANRFTGLVLGGLSLAMLGACNEDSDTRIAQSAAAKQPREVCTEQVVTRQKPVKDKDRVLGTVAGALVGGVVGHEVGGKGTSQDVATVAGAAAGGYAGNRVQKSVQNNATEQTTERVCETVYD
jgi:uncharacterized protein YcfJ